MSRWTYIIPRLIIIGLIALALWMGADPLTRNAIVSALQQTTGAKVEVGQLRFSTENETIFLKDISVADAKNPMKNLAQADMVYVEFDAQALLQRKFRIKNGQTSRLMFGTPRTTDGRLDPASTPKTTPFASVNGIKQDYQAISQRWLDQLEPLPATIAAIENQNLFNAAKRLSETWTSRLDVVQKQIQQLEQRTLQIGTTLKNFDGNVLRWKDNNFTELKKISSTSEEIVAVLNDYKTAILNEFKDLDQAALRDEKIISQSIQTASFDKEEMSRLLLAKSHDQYVDQVMDLYRWFRQSLPDPTEFRNPNQRGTDIAIPGVKQEPVFLADSIELNGEARFLNQHFNFIGNAYNLTNQPQLSELPARFDLRAQGNQHFMINCVVDRRNNTPIDRLKIICPEIEVNGRILGHPSSLQVTMGPACRIQAEVDIQVVDDELSGTLVFRHSNVSLHVDQLSELAGGTETALQMNEGGMGLINEFSSTIQLSGTIDSYRHTAKSDLGGKFANAVNSILEEKKDSAIAQRKAMLAKTKQLQIESINESIVNRLNIMSQSLQQNDVRVAELKSIRPSTSKIDNEFY